MDRVLTLLASGDHSLHVFKLETKEFSTKMTETMVPGSYEECFIVKKYRSSRGQPIFFIAKRHCEDKMYDGWYASGKRYGGSASEIMVLINNMIDDAWEYA